MSGEIELSGKLNLGELNVREKWLHPLGIVGKDEQYKKLPTGRIYIGKNREYIGHILLSAQKHITVFTINPSSKKLNVITLPLSGDMEIVWDVV